MSQAKIKCGDCGEFYDESVMIWKGEDCICGKCYADRFDVKTVVQSEYEVTEDD